MNHDRAARMLGRTLLFLTLLLIIWKANERGLSHDEHQFVSPGLLTIEQGRMPYRDYAIFHVPNLVLLHGALAHFAQYKLLVLRLFTAICIWLNVVLLAWFAARQFAAEGPLVRVMLAAATVALFIFSPVFSYTAHFIWNHGTPLMVTFAAWLFLIETGIEERRGLRLCASGFLLALAAGMRLTFAPLAVPFGLSVLFLFPDRNWRSRMRDLALFATGGFLGALPCLYFLMLSPEQFVFCNLESARYAQVWRELPFWRGDLTDFVDPDAGLLDSAHPALGGVSLESKVGAFVRRTLTTHWPVHAAALLLGLPGLVVIWRRGRSARVPAASAWLCLPFVVWGCFAPSRFNRQYPYPLVFFLVLIALCGLAALLAERRARTWCLYLFAALVMSALIIGERDYRGLKGAHKVRRWGPLRVHTTARRLQSEMPNARRVLTLDPLLVQEAGLEVYPELAAGEFPWRLAHLVPAEKRALFHLIGPADLAAWLANDLPDAVLVGDDPEIGAPFADYAREHGFLLVDRKHGLWVAPTH